MSKTNHKNLSNRQILIKLSIRQFLSNLVYWASGPIYRWQQRAGPRDYGAPYLQYQEWFLAEEEEARDEQDEARLKKIRQLSSTKDKDFWTVDWEKGEITRHHGRRRKAKFDPKFNGDAPVPWTMFTNRRRTTLHRAGSEKVEDDDWLTPDRKFEETW